MNPGPHPPIRPRETPAARLARRAGSPGERRGVAAILAMMFLIMFGSLSAAMAIASRGNITTAATHLHVTRAQSAAETGLAIARARLRESAQRFLMSDSDVNGTMGWDLWRGSMGGFSTYQVIPGATGRQDLAAPAGLAAAVAEAHGLDQNIVTDVGISTVTIANRPASVSASAYRASNWVYTPAVAIEPTAAGVTVPPLCYQITYAPLANGTDVRVIVTGYDYSYTRKQGGAARPITRTIMQDFRLTKRVEHAIISPTRIMIGKNVQVHGSLGCRFTDVSYNNGDPLVTRSDFTNLDAELDDKLGFFQDAVANADVDNDNRLRTTHTGEAGEIGEAQTEYEDDGGSDTDVYADATGDGYVDEFDVFINHFDADNDKRVSAAEFTAGGQLIDAGLFMLIDSSDPDRNRNGVYGFVDANSNGRYDSGEGFLDLGPGGVANDHVLGYMDGYLDKRDRYVKVQGNLTFKVAANDWESARGPIDDRIQGAIRPNEGDPPQVYGAGDTVLPNINAASFASTRNSLQSLADGGTLATQTAAPVQVPGASAPVVQTLTADANLDGLPDNYATAYWEKMPFNSPTFSDYYYRPVYRNIVFTNVEIPVGTNALFENCWFIGVTWVRCHTDNTNRLWGEYGKLKMDASDTRPMPAAVRSIYGDGAGETSYPTMLPASARPPNQMILMANPPMDKADIPANQVGFVQGYNNLPDPLLIGGLRVTDTKAYSNNLRFHNCLFVGSIVSDSPNGFAQARNKIQFTGATRFATVNPEAPATPSYNIASSDLPEVQKSSLMLPNYSVDLGSFNSPQSQSLQLNGAIIAGVLDVRGNADINGALMLTYAPVRGQGPLQDALGNPAGNPATFNTTLGYFGPGDGDEESVDPLTLPLVNGQRIVGWDTNGDGISDVPSSQPQPGGSTAVPFNGFGSIRVKWDPNMKLPNGIMLPMQFDALPNTYAEGKPS